MKERGGKRANPLSVKGVEHLRGRAAQSRDIESSMMVIRRKQHSWLSTRGNSRWRVLQAEDALWLLTAISKGKQKESWEKLDMRDERAATAV